MGGSKHSSLVFIIAFKSILSYNLTIITNCKIFVNIPRYKIEDINIISLNKTKLAVCSFY